MLELVMCAALQEFPLMETAPVPSLTAGSMYSDKWIPALLCMHVQTHTCGSVQLDYCIRRPLGLLLVAGTLNALC